VLYAINSKTLFDHMHELGTAFYCKYPSGPVDKPETIYKVIYYAENRQIFYEGPLELPELEQLKKMAIEVSTIEYDKFRDELIIKE